MKKNTLFIAMISLSISLVSCAGGEEQKEVTTAEPTATESTETINWNVDTRNSNVRWTGTTAGAAVYSHFGDLSLAGGSVTTSGDAITAGNFTVDMSTIEPKDENYSEESPASKLVSHLATPEFFNTAEHPKAMFEITSIDGNTIKGKLTIRGITNEESIAVSNMNIAEDGSMTATGTLVFDRQKYDVAWKHFMKDTVLSDDISLEITLVATRV